MSTDRKVVMALAIALGLGAAALAAPGRRKTMGAMTLWDLAKSKQSVHRFSTLFPAQNVREHLSTEEGIRAAIDWCNAKTVTIGAHTYSAGSDTWEAYRGELMARLSRERVLGPARRVNPKARLITKYPQWYDSFHERAQPGVSLPVPRRELGRGILPG